MKLSLKRESIPRFIIHVLMVIIASSLYVFVLQGYKEIIIGFIDNQSIDMSSYSVLTSIITTCLILFLGRFFCGWFCVFGFLNELIYNSFSFLRKKRKPNKVNGINLYWKYILLVLIIIVSWYLRRFDFNQLNPWTALYLIRELNIMLLEIPIALIILIISFIGTIFINRFYCRFICPLGALQGIISKVKFISIKRDLVLCGSCNMCELNCPMSIQKVAINCSSECISCLKCVQRCKKQNATIFLKKHPIKSSKSIVIGILIMSSLPLINFIVNIEKTPVPVEVATIENKLVEEIKTEVIPIFEPQLLPQVKNNIRPGKSHLIQVNKTFNDGTFTGESGSIIVDIVIENDQIISIELIADKEDQLFLRQVLDIIPNKIIQKQTNEVDVVSGATNTSTRYLKAIEVAISQARLE